jgi:hypothetical protein
MSNFVRRLKYYGVGFGLGLVFLIFFFQNRGCSWLPDNRIKNAVLERVIVVPESQKMALENEGITTVDILKFLEKGSIQFTESDKSGPNKRYKIELEGKKPLYFTLPEESFISAVYLNPPTDVEDRKGLARMVHFPAQEHLVFIDTTDIKTCEIQKFGWENGDDVLRLMKKHSAINFDLSVFEKVAKPVHAIEIYDDKKDTIRFTSIWYKDKINIMNLTNKDEISCP